MAGTQHFQFPPPSQGGGGGLDDGQFNNQQASTGVLEDGGVYSEQQQHTPSYEQTQTVEQQLQQHLQQMQLQVSGHLVVSSCGQLAECDITSGHLASVRYN